MLRGDVAPGGSVPTTYTLTRSCTHQHTQHTSPHRPTQTPSMYGQVQRHGHKPTHALNTEAHAGRDVTHTSMRMCTHTHPHTPATVWALGEPHGCVHGPSQTHRHRRACRHIHKRSHVCPHTRTGTHMQTSVCATAHTQAHSLSHTVPGSVDLLFPWAQSAQR